MTLSELLNKVLINDLKSIYVIELFIRIRNNPDRNSIILSFFSDKLQEQQHRTISLYFIGFIHCYGCDKNYTEAFINFQKAANNKNLNALFYLGECYYYGHGITQSYDQALICYEKAGEFGHHLSLYSIGHYYFINKYYEKALTYFKLSANLKNASAVGRIGTFLYYGYGVERDITDAHKHYEKAYKMSIEKNQEIGDLTEMLSEKYYR